MDSRAVIWSVVELSRIIQGNLREDWEFCRSEALITRCQESFPLEHGANYHVQESGFKECVS